MSSVVIYDPSDTVVANRVTQYLPTANTPEYSGNPNTLINPDLSAVAGVSAKYWKYSSGDIVEMSSAEKDAYDESLREYFFVKDGMNLLAVDEGVTNVIANGRPAIEIGSGITGFGSMQMKWLTSGHSKIRITVPFVAKEDGTLQYVRIAAKLKAQATGEDSTSAFTPQDAVAVTINNTTIGEIFEAQIELDATGLEADDNVAIHIGRDGDSEIGTGSDDNTTVPIQIFSCKLEAN